MRGTVRLGVALLAVLAWPHAVVGEESHEPQPIPFQAPELLTFEELKALSVNPYPRGESRAKYEALWTTPFISNEAFLGGTRPHRPSDPTLGAFLRVVSWNIEQSLHRDAATEAFTNADAFAQRIDRRKARPGSRRFEQVLAERALLEEADVLILQEIDLGMKRSGYRPTAKDLAQALGMNYAYVPIYVEVDPVRLGTEPIRFKEGPVDVEATTYFAADPARYKGLFGVAVLSRYPIVSVETFRLFHQAYDWYWQEKKKIAFLERVRRFGAKEVFQETVHREMKVGGRVYFRVDLHVPQLPERRLSIINVHLEIKCPPEARTRQMAEILSYLKDIPHPVILAGDFNSAPGDLSATSTPKVIDQHFSAPEFWASAVLQYLTPYSLVITTTRFLSNLTRNNQNPTAIHLPVLAPNPTGKLFRLIERFRFTDGGAFDFRGTRYRAVGDSGTLGNSNERDRWAYQTTFRFDRTLGFIGTFRLDWIFVKAYLTHPYDRRGSYRLAPHFGRTLNALNEFLIEPISDHSPNVVDLPFQEPSWEQVRRRRHAQ